MPVPASPSHPLAAAGLARRLLGLSRHPGTGHAKRLGEVWLVVHADWTGVYRLDPRDRRTVHLERALDGDRQEEALAWALRTFAIPPESVRGKARVLAAANSDQAAGAPRAVGATP